jgi:hypothetical protein
LSSATELAKEYKTMLADKKDPADFADVEAHFTPEEVRRVNINAPCVRGDNLGKPRAVKAPVVKKAKKAVSKDIMPMF